jgi:hypothetical protein
MGINESIPIDEKNFGFRLYKIFPNGPLDKVGLKEIENFLIPPEEIYKRQIRFSDYIQENADKKLKLNIYSILKRNFFQVEIQLNKYGDKNGILGGTIRYENFTTAYKKVLHVIKVKENSFSKNELHLDELNDYLIALKPEDGDFQTLNCSNENPLKAFSQILKNNIGKKCNFYIYNKNIGGRNICVDIPNDQMFEMGCDVAFGKLHEFPFLSNEKKNYDEEKELKYDMDEK